MLTKVIDKKVEHILRIQIRIHSVFNKVLAKIDISQGEILNNA
jgi:hypothetical protein